MLGKLYVTLKLYISYKITESFHILPIVYLYGYNTQQ